MVLVHIFKKWSAKNKINMVPVSSYKKFKNHCIKFQQDQHATEQTAMLHVLALFLTWHSAIANSWRICRTSSCCCATSEIGRMGSPSARRSPGRLVAQLARSRTLRAARLRLVIAVKRGEMGRPSDVTGSPFTQAFALSRDSTHLQWSPLTAYNRAVIPVKTMYQFSSDCFKCRLQFFIHLVDEPLSMMMQRFAWSKPF